MSGRVVIVPTSLVLFGQTLARFYEPVSVGFGCYPVPRWFDDEHEAQHPAVTNEDTRDHTPVVGAGGGLYSPRVMDTQVDT